MTQTVRSPFAGKPKTWQVTDRRGNPVIDVKSGKLVADFEISAYAP